MRTIALLIIAALIITPIAAILSTSTVSGDHTSSVALNISTVKGDNTTVFTLSVNNAGPDAIDKVRVTLPAGANFADILPVVKIPVTHADNIVEINMDGVGVAAEGTVDEENTVFLPAGTVVILQDNLSVILPENTDVYIPADVTVTYGGQQKRLSATENGLVEVTAEVRAYENYLDSAYYIFGNSPENLQDVPMENAPYTENITIVNGLSITLKDDNRLRLLSDVRASRVGGLDNTLKLPENITVQIIPTQPSENALPENTIENGIVNPGENEIAFVRPVTVALDTNGAATLTVRAVNNVNLDVGGTYIPAGGNITLDNTVVVIGAGTPVQIFGNVSIRIPENTTAIRENFNEIIAGENAVIENSPNYWGQTTSATYVEWENDGTGIASGDNKNFEFIMTTDNAGGTYTFNVTTTDVNDLQKQVSFVLTVDSTFSRPEIHVDPIWIGENKTITITLKGSEVWSVENLVLRENTIDMPEVDVDVSQALLDNLTSSDNITYTTTYTTKDLLENEGGYLWIYYLGKDTVGNENSENTGNSSFGTTDNLFFIDRSPPVEVDLPAVGFPAGVDNKGTYTLSYTITSDNDNLPLATAATYNPENMKLRITVDNNTPVDVNAALDTGTMSYSLALTDGLHTISARFIDRAGNMLDYENSDNVLIDTTQPTITFTSPSSGAVIKDNRVAIKVTIADATSGIWSWSEYGNLDGTFVRYDNVENENDGFQVDILNASTLEVLYSTGDNTLVPASRPTLSGITLDGVENVRDNLFFTFTFENTIELGDNAYILRVRVGDNLTHVVSGQAENIKQENISFTVDVTAPSPPPTSDLAGSVTAGTSLATAQSTKTSTLTLSGTAEANATITLYVTTDGGATWTATGTTTTASSTGAWTIANFSLATYAGQRVGFAITAKDSGGNESTRSLFGYILYDASKPTTVITSPAATSTTDAPSIIVSGKVTFDSWETASDITMTLQTGTGSVRVPLGSDGSFSYSLALSEGVNTIIAQATDSLGNIGGAVSVNVTRTVTSYVSYAIIVVIIALILAAIAIFRKG